MFKGINYKKEGVMLILMKKIDNPTQGRLFFSYLVVFLFLLSFSLLFLSSFASISYASDSLTLPIQATNASDSQVFSSSNDLDNQDEDLSDISSDTKTVTIQIQGQNDSPITKDRRISDNIEDVAKSRVETELSLDQIHQNLEAFREDVTKAFYAKGYPQLESQLETKVNEIFDKIVEPSTSFEQDSEYKLLSRIFKIEKDLLDRKIEEDGSQVVLESIASSRAMYERELEDGTKYKVSMYVLNSKKSSDGKKSSAILMYIRLASDPLRGIMVHENDTKGYSTHAYSILVPVGENDEIEDTSSKIISEALLQQEIESLKTYLTALEEMNLPDPEAKERIRILKEESLAKMEANLSELSKTNSEELKVKREKFEKLISKRDSTQRTLNHFDITHLIYAPNSDILLPMYEVKKIPLWQFFSYTGHRFKGAYAKPDVVTGLVSASLQVGLLLFLSMYGVSVSAPALIFQFFIASSIGVFGNLYRGIMDTAPDDANHSHLKYLVLRVLKDFVLTAVTLYPYKLLCGEWAEAMTLEFFGRKFLGPSLVSKVVGDSIMFFPRAVKDLTGDKYTKPIKYIPGFTMFNLCYQLYYAVAKFAPKKLAELGKKDVHFNIAGKDTKFGTGILVMVFLGAACYVALNPIAMSAMETHYLYSFFKSLDSDDYTEENIESMVEQMKSSIRNNSFIDFDHATGGQADSVRKYSKLSKHFLKTLNLTMLDLRYTRKSAGLSVKKARYLARQEGLIAEMGDLFRNILIEIKKHRQDFPSTEDPKLSEEEVKFITKKFIQRIKPYASAFISNLKAYDRISLYIEKLDYISEEGGFVGRSYKTAQSSLSKAVEHYTKCSDVFSENPFSLPMY